MRILPDFGEKMQSIRANEEKTWIEVIENAKSSGELMSSVNSEELARLFIASKDGIGMQIVLENRLKHYSEEIISAWSSLYKFVKA